MLTIKVHMLAFGDGKIREVDLPSPSESADNDALLDLTFMYGQNDFQPKPFPSVSVGDVIALPDGSLHRVLGCGWEHLPAGTDVNTLERGHLASCR
jgi:hypothetical protein